MKKPKAAAKGKPSTDQPKEEYKPTAREQEAIDAFVAARKARKLSSRLTIKKSASDGFDVDVDHKDQFTGHILLMQALGTAGLDFVGGLMRLRVSPLNSHSFRRRRSRRRMKRRCPQEGVGCLQKRCRQPRETTVLL